MISKDKFIVTWKKFHQASLLFCFVFINLRKLLHHPVFLKGICQMHLKEIFLNSMPLRNEFPYM